MKIIQLQFVNKEEGYDIWVVLDNGKVYRKSVGNHPSFWEEENLIGEVEKVDSRHS